MQCCVPGYVVPDVLKDCVFKCNNYGLMNPEDEAETIP